VVLEDFIPKGKFSTAILTQLERITQPVSDFVRGNPIVATAAVGAGFTGLAAVATTIIRKKRKKKKKAVRRKRAVRKRGRVKKRKRRIIRGRGLGRGEIRHAGKGTKGVKLVSFTTKDGKRVKFRVKGTSKRRKGFVKRRKKR